MHHEYVALFDAILDTGLKKKFEQTDVEVFYKTFEEKRGLYEAMNLTVYETIWSLVNCEFFKREFIKFKDILGMKSTEVNSHIELLKIDEAMCRQLD